MLHSISAIVESLMTLESCRKHLIHPLSLQTYWQMTNLFPPRLCPDNQTTAGLTRFYPAHLFLCYSCGGCQVGGGLCLWGWTARWSKLGHWNKVAWIRAKINCVTTRRVIMGEMSRELLLFLMCSVLSGRILSNIPDPLPLFRGDLTSFWLRRDRGTWVSRPRLKKKKKKTFINPTVGFEKNVKCRELMQS